MSETKELLEQTDYAPAVRGLIKAAVAKRTDSEKRQMFAAPGGLYKFLRFIWPILEPDTPMQEGWAMQAVCEHLEACADGRIKRLLINISPGSAKSTIVSVAFPLWLWSAKDRQGERFLNLSYSGNLPERDNRKKLLVLNSPEFKRLYPKIVLDKQGEQIISNKRTGYCMALGIGSSVTGNRGSVLILDDPNNVADIMSDDIRKSAAITFREAASNRLNSMEDSVIIVIQQRSHMGDVSGIILDEQLNYEHLCIPAVFEGVTCRTSIGWEDPRTELGESFWPERFPDHVLANLRKEIGETAWHGQYLQTPVPRGGAILKSEYWRDYTSDRWPKFDYVLASVDTAYTEKETNDPSALTVWGTYNDPETGDRCAVLIWAWRKYLQIMGPPNPRYPSETDAEYKARTSHQWGLVEWLNYDCNRHGVKKLLVESKASGISVIQAMGRLFAGHAYRIESVNPGRIDKVGRMHRVEAEFAQGYIWAPLDKKYAQMVVDECAVAPHGRTIDLVDSTTQAVFQLRQMGLLERREDQFIKEQERKIKYKPVQPLYNI